MGICFNLHPDGIAAFNAFENFGVTFTLGLITATIAVLTTRVALETTSKIFEVTGTRAAASKYRFDRFWRNVRTHTLHDPVVYKVYEVGNWVLNQQIPVFTLYT